MHKVKKILISVFISLLLLASLMASVLATDSSPAAVSYPTFGSISVYMPEITAEVKGSGYDLDLESITAMLGSEKLECVDAHVYDRTQDTSRIFILVDLSSNMASELDQVKSDIVQFVNTVGDEDEVVLIPYTGVDGQMEQYVFSGKYKPLIINEIRNFSCVEGEAQMFKAVLDLCGLADSEYSEFTREYAVVFTAGNGRVSGGVSYSEVYGVVEMHGLPIYSCLSVNMMDGDATAFGEFSRVSGGGYADIGDEEGYSRLLEEINDVTLLTLKSASNVADGSVRQLSVRFGTLDVQPVNVPVRYSAPEPAPTPEAIEEVSTQDVEEDASEKSGLFGGERGGLKIGLVIMLVGFVLLAIVLLVLILSAPSAKKVESPERNIGPDGQDDLRLSNKRRRVSAASKNDLPKRAAQIEQKEFLVKLQITSMYAEARVREVRIAPNASIHVGRSSECEICVPDGKLSRKHFLIFSSGSVLMIQDMKSTNGTIFNGKRLAAPMVLKEDDYIMAGMTKVKVMAIR